MKRVQKWVDDLSWRQTNILLVCLCLLAVITGVWGIFATRGTDDFVFVVFFFGLLSLMFAVGVVFFGTAAIRNIPGGGFAEGTRRPPSREQKIDQTLLEPNKDSCAHRLSFTYFLNKLFFVPTKTPTSATSTKAPIP